MVAISRSWLGAAGVGSAMALLMVGSEARGDVHHEVFDVEPGGALRIDASRGSVRVRSAETSQVEVEVHRFGLPPRSRLDTERDGNDVIVRSRGHGPIHWLPPWAWRHDRRR